MNGAHHHLWILLLVLAAALLGACAQEPEDAVAARADAPSAAEAGAAAGEAGTAADAASATMDTSWLPPKENGKLPRALRGYRLGDPAPAGSKPSTSPWNRAAHEFGTVIDGGTLWVHSFEGRIYRISYQPATTLPLGAAMQAARALYGEPDTEEATLVQFEEGLGMGDTILGVRDKSVQLFIEDAGTALAVYQASQ
ncbi:MAG TPA: hypothetical protein VFG21_04025 [Xanthomonadaceae bacterium]|nr:hypothetical protein [Xanthomonadaceae bacterium]